MRTITIEEGQNLIDIAVQEFGTADGLSTICDLNDLEFDEDLKPGQILVLPDLDPDNDIQAYFASEGIKVNSHTISLDVEVLATNDDEIITDNDNNALQV